jgi:predicted glutamine amidotransferase
MRSFFATVAAANTQPFVPEPAGPMHAFAHSSRVTGIEQQHAGEWRRIRPVGDADSEIAFCLLLERLAPRDALPAAGIAIDGESQDPALFASVALTEEAWQPLAAGEVIAVNDGRPLARPL